MFLKGSNRIEKYHFITCVSMSTNLSLYFKILLSLFIRYMYVYPCVLIDCWSMRRRYLCPRSGILTSSARAWNTITRTDNGLSTKQQQQQQNITIKQNSTIEKKLAWIGRKTASLVCIFWINLGNFSPYPDLLAGGPVV